MLYDVGVFLLDVSNVLPFLLLGGRTHEHHLLFPILDIVQNLLATISREVELSLLRTLESLIPHIPRIKLTPSIKVVV